MLAEFSMLTASISQSKELFKTIWNSRDEKIAREKLEPILKQLEESETNALKLEIAALKVERENEHLKNRLQQLESWENQKARYTERYFPSGRSAYVLKEQPPEMNTEVFFCQKCLDNKNKTFQMIQWLDDEQNNVLKHLQCVECKDEFYLDDSFRDSGVTFF